MEGIRVASSMVQTLRERGFETELDHLNVLSERSSIGAAVQLLELMQLGSLTRLEQSRWDDLQAAGVDKFEDFRYEELIVEQLEKSIEWLEMTTIDVPEGESAFNEMSGQVLCELPVLDTNLLSSSLNLIKELVSRIVQDCQKVLDQLGDSSRNSLPGYRFELLDDWRVFTLCTVDEIERLWTATVSCSIQSDKDYIDQQRDRFLCSSLADLNSSLRTVVNVLYFLQSAIKYFDSEMQSNISALAQLRQSFNHALKRTEGLKFSSEPMMMPKYNQDLMAVQLEVDPLKLENCPQHKLKSLIKQAQDYSRQMAALSKELSDLQNVK